MLGLERGRSMAYKTWANYNDLFRRGHPKWWWWFLGITPWKFSKISGLGIEGIVFNKSALFDCLGWWKKWSPRFCKGFSDVSFRGSIPLMGIFRHFPAILATAATRRPSPLAPPEPCRTPPSLQRNEVWCGGWVVGNVIRDGERNCQKQRLGCPVGS